MSQKNIIVIDIDPVVRSGICSFLKAQGYIVTEASNCQDAHLQWQKGRPDAVVLDLYLPNGDVPQLLRRAKCMRPAVPVVLLSGQASIDSAARGLRMAAEHILFKPVELAELHSTLLRLLGGGSVSGQAAMPASTPRRECPDPFVGSSPAIRRLREIARRVLTSESPILLQGETGSGKGVLATWLHRNGPRRRQPFLDLNCAGL